MEKSSEETVYPDGMTREEWLAAIRDRHNPFFRWPENLDQRIWRYMDFAKFVAMLDSRTLFFPSVVNLGDPFEGTVSQENVRRRGPNRADVVNRFREAWPNLLDEDGQHNLYESLEQFDQIMSHRLKWSAEWTYVSCWHMNDDESAAMWKLYALSNQAIAVQSTFRRLIDCLEPHKMPPHGEPIIAQVNYIDFKTEVVRRDVHLAEFFYKRKSFEHEREVRAVIQRLPMSNHTSHPVDVVVSFPRDYDVDRDPVPGIHLSVDLDKLIEAIYVAPTAPRWLWNLTRSIAKQYRLSQEVLESELFSEDVLY